MLRTCFYDGEVFVAERKGHLQEKKKGGIIISEFSRMQMVHKRNTIHLHICFCDGRQNRNNLSLEAICSQLVSTDRKTYRQTHTNFHILPGRPIKAAACQAPHSTLRIVPDSGRVGLLSAPQVRHLGSNTRCKEPRPVSMV